MGYDDASQSEKREVDNIYDSLAYTETGIYPDPWMRTKGMGSGSSAYGPVMMLGGKGSKIWDAYYDKYQNKKISPNVEETKYMTRFMDQASEFLAPVDEKAREGTTYGYGGSGVLRSDRDKALYENLAKKIIKFELDYRYDGDVKQFVKGWRGDVSKYKAGGKDPGNKTYFDKFWNRYNRLTELDKYFKDRDFLMPEEATMDKIRIPR